MHIERKTLSSQPYIYVPRECGHGPEIAQAMGSAFGEVFAFTTEHQITPRSMPMTVYLEMPETVLRFRGGFIVTADDAAKATGNIKADTLPAGEVMYTVHVGSYERMNETHQALWRHMEENEIPGTMPIWEIYIDDPEHTEADKLRTGIYRSIG